MKRASYRYAQGWTLSKVFSLLFPLGLAVYCAATGAWPYFALCLATFLLFNYNNLVIFAPAYRAIVREQIPEPSLRDKAAIAVPYEEAVKEEEPDKKQ